MVVLSEWSVGRRPSDHESKGTKHNYNFPNRTGRWRRRPMAFVYILHCADGSYYVGKTDDLLTRLQEHQSGAGADYTSARRPVEMVYAEEHSTTRSAKNRERQLKRWSRAQKDALISQDANRLKRA
jgi:predicted GIY-YIG superfamily endonuclease